VTRTLEPPPTGRAPDDREAAATQADYVIPPCRVPGCVACGPPLDVAAAARELRAAVALLDRRAPGWRRVVDPDRLRMASPTHCVLGQVFGDYQAGRDALVEGAGLEPLGLRAFLASFPADLWRAELARVPGPRVRRLRTLVGRTS
jgi:hypothetical protein